MAAEKTTEPDEVLTDEELQAAAAPEPDSANNNEAHKRTVVVAEDESVNRMDLVAMLEDNGYEVVGEAANGEEAVELTRKFRPSVVCMDVKMPRMDGIDAVCAVRGWGGVCTRFHPRKRMWAICARGVEARMADALEALI